MEGNKDDSSKCILIAQRLIDAGQYDKAIKYLNKAERLYPSQRAKDLLEHVSKLNSGQSDSGGGGTSNSSETETRKRRGSFGRNKDTSEMNSEPKEKDYTDEQLAACKRIKKCKDYYEILGVEKDCSETDLKKAYRKLALQMHPDKNSAPGSTEAFKAIGNAFSVLSDSGKRKKYDLYGPEEEQRRSGGRSGEYDYSHGFEGDISPEELFNMFFGGGFPSGVHVNRRTFTSHRSRSTEEVVYISAGIATLICTQDNIFDIQREILNLMKKIVSMQRAVPRCCVTHHRSSATLLLQLAPILLLVFLSLLSSFFVSDPVFSLQRSDKYVVERRTSHLRIPYFVRSDFTSNFAGDLRRMERQVEEEFVSNLRSNCWRERSYKENMLWKARNYADAKLYERAQSMETPSCDNLQKLYS